jgi:hypothetical protein
MIWLLAALFSVAYGQACVCSVQGAYPTNWTGLYTKPNGCVIGDKYTMPHSYPHVQLCNACVADTCACCRGTDNNFMRGIPLDPEAKGPPAPTWNEGTQMVVIILCCVLFGACALAGAFLLVAGVVRLLIGGINCVLRACHYCCCKKPELDLREPKLKQVVVV